MKNSEYINVEDYATDTLDAIFEYMQNKTDTEHAQYLNCDYDVDPDCLSRIKEGILSLSLDTTNYGTHVLHLVDKLPKSLETLNLGHDGIIVCNDTDESVVSVFERLIRSLPKLKTIYHCGYYSDFNSSDIRAAASACSRQLNVIEIY